MWRGFIRRKLIDCLGVWAYKEVLVSDFQVQF